MCEEAVTLDMFGEFTKNNRVGRGTSGRRYWRYRVQFVDKDHVQEVADWGTGHVWRNRGLNGEPNFEAQLSGKNLLRFLTFYEPCMTNEEKNAVVVRAIADLRERYDAA